MSIPGVGVVGVVSDNLRLRGSMTPIGRRAATHWARGLGLRRGGGTVLYTGQMYQLVPYLEGVAAAGHGRETGLRRFGSASVPASERATYERVLVDIVMTLRSNAIDVGYLYDDDLYTGTLAHGAEVDEEALRAQGTRTLERFRKHEVRDVITVDPHTTTMLGTVLPGLVEGFDVRVRSYLEALAEARPRVRTYLSAEIAIHDGCGFAGKAEGEPPRALLRGAGMTVREPDNDGTVAWCCGGPERVLQPDKVEATVRQRVEQLRELAPAAVTLCPVCLANLQRAAGGEMRFTDISHYLRVAYSG